MEQTDQRMCGNIVTVKDGTKHSHEFCGFVEWEIVKRNIF